MKMGMRENPLALELILCRRSECLGRLQDHRDVGVLAHVQAVIRRYIRTRMYINVSEICAFDALDADDKHR